MTSLFWKGIEIFSLSILGVWSGDGLGNAKLINGLDDLRGLFQWFHDPMILQRFLLLLGHPGPPIGQDRLQEQLHVLVRQHLPEEREWKCRRHLFLFKPGLWNSGHIFLRDKSPIHIPPHKTAPCTPLLGLRDYWQCRQESKTQVTSGSCGGRPTL